VHVVSLLRERAEEDERAAIEKNFNKIRRQQTGRGGLLNFVRHFWHALEPKTRPMVEGWPLEAICIHLEALTFGDIPSNRLLINVPPGFMKSLLVDVFWPAWEWGPCNMPYLRYIAFSYSDAITTRDNNKVVRLIQSPAYQQLWGDRFRMVKTGERRIENDQTGYKVATSVGGVSTGERGDRVILDDPHNVIKAESDLERGKTVRFVRESMSNRLNDERSAIVIIMQRLHEGDVSGDILAREADYCHLMIPMHFDPLRYPASADGESTEDPETGEQYTGNEIGWIDPRASNEDGEALSPRELAANDGLLAWEARFPARRVKEFEYELGQYAFAGQYQQSPTPRKGGIFKREYWQPYIPPVTGSRKGMWPDFDFIVVSVDSAFTEKEENDPTGCTTWGIWVDPTDGYPKVMLIMAWRKHLPIHGEDQDPQERGETDSDYAARCMPGWGIVEYVAWNCRRFGGADVLLVEAKANGLDVIREMQRLYGHEKWGVVKIVPKTDKVARALSVQPAFAQHIVHAPDRDFARMVQDEMAIATSPSATATASQPATTTRWSG
jgi:hypothetical protein